MDSGYYTTKITERKKGQHLTILQSMEREATKRTEAAHIRSIGWMCVQK